MITIPKRESGRPRDKRDVDEVFGEYELKPVQEDARTITWETSLGLNVVFGVMALVMLGLLVAFAQFHLLANAQVGVGIRDLVVLAILGVAIVAFVLAAGNRCRVVIDLQKRELRAYAGLRLRLRGVLAVDDIASLYVREVSAGAATGVDTDTSSERDLLLVAELTDGRVVLLTSRTAPAFGHQIERLRRQGGSGEGFSQG